MRASRPSPLITEIDMATIIIEDGSNVAGANSYITQVELSTYAADRGVTIASADTKLLLIESMDYLESLAYIGLKRNLTQPLQWPRLDVVVDGFILDADSIPQLLKDGQAEVALAIDDSQSPLANIDRLTKSVGVGSGAVSVTYADNSQATTIVRKISAKLNKLLINGLNGTTMTVIKA